ncbi:hypothetical protein fugu_000353 [Takifugu bimaculatus]|uniref:SKICH domain-containing protein n=1 Tax=Takifugu bimaculatus TaxID=433685 RepID=A0A4Z2CGY3_9TELE|nr:hypothetical protein fugu_000353 [Takifugu bimaculatus]
MDSCAKPPETPSSLIFSQVVFIDIPHSYPPAAPLTCCYTVTAAFQPSNKDWVGIFRVGWSKTRDYHTFVWVDSSQDGTGHQSEIRQAVFNDYYLPKDEIEFYQFCYVDGAGQVRGASTPFCFRKSVEQNTESSPDDNLLVVTTQEQLEQNTREKDTLQKELTHLMEENETLKKGLEKEGEESASLKRQKEQKEKENSQLVEELGQIKKENENLKSTSEQQMKEMERLKELLRETAAEQEEHRASLTTALKEQEEQAQMKIKQLRAQQAELKARLEAQSQEMDALNFKFKNEERELFQMKDCVQLLKSDFQISEEEKEGLSAELQRLQSLACNMDDMMRKSQELCSRLSQQESCQSENLKARCQALAAQLTDAQAELAAAKEQSKSAERSAEQLKEELEQVKEKLADVVSSYEKAQQKSGKQEAELREACVAITDNAALIEEKERLIAILSNEKRELAQQNQDLISDVEELHRICAELQTAPPAGTTEDPADQHHRETSEQSEGLCAVRSPVEEFVMCRHCQASFSFITQVELEQHEQSHRICPFCQMVCDDMDQSVFEDHVYSHEL